MDFLFGSSKNSGTSTNNKPSNSNKVITPSNPAVVEKKNAGTTTNNAKKNAGTTTNNAKKNAATTTNNIKKNADPNKAMVGGVLVNRSKVKTSNVGKQPELIPLDGQNLNALTKTLGEARALAIKSERNAKIKTNQFSEAQIKAEIARSEYLKRKANMNAKQSALLQTQKIAAEHKKEAARKNLEKAASNLKNAKMFEQNIQQQPINLTRFGNAINLYNLETEGKVNKGIQTNSDKAKSPGRPTKKEKLALQLLFKSIKNSINNAKSHIKKKNMELENMLQGYRNPSTVRLPFPKTGNTLKNINEGRNTLVKANKDMMHLQDILKRDASRLSQMTNQKSLVAMNLKEKISRHKEDISRLKGQKNLLKIKVKRNKNSFLHRGD